MGVHVFICPDSKGPRLFLVVVRGVRGPGGGWLISHYLKANGKGRQAWQAFVILSRNLEQSHGVFWVCFFSRRSPPKKNCRDIYVRKIDEYFEGFGQSLFMFNALKWRISEVKCCSSFILISAG